MRQHSRCVVAAAAAATFIVATASPMVSPAWARSHHPRHGPGHVSHAPSLQAPVSGMHSSATASVPQEAAADAGKTGLPSSLGPKDVLAILGKNVHSSTGEDMGRLVDVIVDTEGRPRAAIIDFGGFLGVGSRKVAVDWRLLQFHPTDRKAPMQLSVTRAEVQAAPEYKEKNEPAQVVAPPTEAPAAPNATK